MISDKMKELVNNSSVIRAMFEEGKKMAKLYGAENVYDFSLGNPSVEPPKAVKSAIIKILEEKPSVYVHGYMSNPGYEEVRAAIANHINELYNTNFSEKNILMTVGAAGGLNVILKTLLNPNDEVIVFAPFFGEYRNYIKNYDGVVVEVSANPPSFQPKLDEFKKKLTKNTKAVIINTPNNPTGVIYSEETIIKLSDILREKEKEFNTSIYLISDEPYRELAYDGAEVPYITNYYNNAVVGYSYSKSLSLPGERIGYLVIPDEIDDFFEVSAGASVANRILGFVNAPSLMQLAVAECLNEKTDIEVYNKNREFLYNSLVNFGYECAKPEGAFYLFLKCPNGDDKEFTALAKEERVLVVPGSTFACPGYVRIAYCVDYGMIERALPAFKKVFDKIKR